MAAAALGTVAVPCPVKGASSFSLDWQTPRVLIETTHGPKLIVQPVVANNPTAIAIIVHFIETAHPVILAPCCSQQHITNWYYAAEIRRCISRVDPVQVGSIVWVSVIVLSVHFWITGSTLQLDHSEMSKAIRSSWLRKVLFKLCSSLVVNKEVPVLKIFMLSA